MLKIDPDYYNKELETILKTYACKMRLNVQQENGNKQESKEGMCAEKEGMTNEGVICTAGAGSGDPFSNPSIQCYQTENIPEEEG